MAITQHVNDIPIEYKIWDVLFRHPLPPAITYKGQRYNIVLYGDNNSLPGVTIGNIRYVVQNPTLTSPWAEMARSGAKIIWIMNIQPDAPIKWLARVVNGQVHRAIKRQGQNGRSFTDWVEITWGTLRSSAQHYEPPPNL